MLSGERVRIPAPFVFKGGYFLLENISLSLLRQARRNQRFTLRQVANLLGISPSSMWKTENGKVALSVERLFQLLHIYDCSITDILVKE